MKTLKEKSEWTNGDNKKKKKTFKIHQKWGKNAVFVKNVDEKKKKIKMKKK